MFQFALIRSKDELNSFSPIIELEIPTKKMASRIQTLVSFSAAFARPLKATIDLLHLTSVLENSNQSKVIEMAVKKTAAYDINFNMTNRNPNDSFITDIETAIKKNKPSMMIMFTAQQRNWIDKIFLSSKSAAYSFNAIVPLLVFNKTLDK